MSIHIKAKQNKNNNNNIIKEEEEQETKDDSYHLSTNSQSQDILDKKIIELIPGNQILNDVQNRFFILSPTVELGFERECNKYDFIRDKKPLGKGAFGEVWKVMHEKSQKNYCVKILDKRDIFEQKLINQINKEICIMYNINHPYSIKLFNHFEDNEKLYLIMELATGGNLYNYIQNFKNKKIDFIKKIIIQTIEIIKYLHSKEIIYRDIKPENILLDKDNNVKLCDYGWASFITPGKFLTVYCGTPEYVAPEMVKKYPYNEKIDIWGIGVLIFELVFNYPPFSSSLNEERFNNIKNRKINWPQDLNETHNDVKDLIEKILQLNPNERLSLEEIEKHPWLNDTYLKMKENKQTNDTFEKNEMTQTEIYKNNIMDNGVSKLFNSDFKNKRTNSYFELENDGSLTDKEILNIYKMENKQLRLKILKVEENNKILKKKCCIYNDLCNLNEKLNKKIEEDNKQILLLKSKCDQKDEIINDNEVKIKELTAINEKYKNLDKISNQYKILEEELKNLKLILNQKSTNINNIDINKKLNEEEIIIFLNNFLNEFKKENEKLSFYNQTKNKLIENIIKNEFEGNKAKIRSIFDEYMTTKSKPYEIIEYLNIKMEELYGYKTKAERYQSQTELLLNEQKILKDQIKVYKKMYYEISKMKEFQDETLEKYKLNDNIYKEILKRAKKYIQKHFSISTQNELLKILEKN